MLGSALVEVALTKIDFKCICAWAVGFALSIVVLSGCGGGGVDLGAGTREYLGTQSPGDVWGWSVTPTTFSGTNEATGYTYSGTTETLSTGFLRLTISASTDPDVSVGDMAFGLELPGVGIIISPVDSTEPPIVCTTIGEAIADGAYDFNWIVIPRTGWNGASDEVYGTATMTYADPDVSASILGYDFGDNLINNSNATGTNSGGRVTFVGGGVGSSTANGTFVLDNGVGEGGVVGVVQATSSLGLTTASSGNYRGVLFFAGGESAPIAVTGNGDGTMLAQVYDDVEAGTFGVGSDATITFTSEPSPGLFRGTVATGGGTLNVVFVVNVVGSTYIVLGVASDGTTIMCTQYTG